METACDMQRAIWEVLDEFFTGGLRHIRSEFRRKHPKWNVSVIRQEEASEYRIRERNAQIEIRDAFNSHLVIQQYEGREKRILLFIPPDWREKVVIRLKKGCIRCFQKDPYKRLDISAGKGTVIYEKAREWTKEEYTV